MKVPTRAGRELCTDRQVPGESEERTDRGRARAKNEPAGTQRERRTDRQGQSESEERIDRGRVSADIKK